MTGYFVQWRPVLIDGAFAEQSVIGMIAEIELMVSRGWAGKFHKSEGPFVSIAEAQTWWDEVGQVEGWPLLVSAEGFAPD